MTPEQEKALALARARRRRAEAEGTAKPAESPEFDLSTAKGRIEAAKAGKLPVSPERAGQQAYIDALTEQRMDDGPFGAFASNFGRGVSFGFADEIAAGIGSALGGGQYGEILSGLRGQDQYLRDQFPVASTTGEIAGAVASPINKLLTPAAPAASLPGRMAQGAGWGAASGALYGAGSADGDIGNALSGAVLGGGAGLALGGAVPLIAEAGKAGVRAFKDWSRNRGVSNALAGNMGVSPEAGRVIGDMVAIDDPAAMRATLGAMGPEAMLADASPQLSMTLRSSMRTPNPGSGLAIDRVGARADDAYSALKTSILGDLPPKSAGAVMDDIVSGSAAARSSAYSSAYAKPIDYASEEGAKLLDDITPRLPGKAISYANELMRLRGEKSAQIMATIADDGSVTFKRPPDVRQWDYIKQGLDMLAESGEGAGALGGQTRLGSAYKSLARDVRDSVAALVPEYRTALDTAADAISERNAVKFGTEILSPKNPTAAVLEEISGATKAELEAMKAGVRAQMDEVLGNVKASATNPNVDAKEAMKAFSDLSSRNAQAKLEALFGSEWPAIKAAYDKAGAAIGLSVRTRGGSDTAANLAFNESVKGAVEVGAMRKGKPAEALKEFFGGLTGASTAALTTRQREVAAEIADILTRPDGAQTLEMILSTLRANPTSPAAGSATYNALMGGARVIPAAVGQLRNMLGG